jgi:hypothetical protein
MKLLPIVALLIGIPLAGCASGRYSPSQDIRLRTAAADGSTITGASCRLTNGEGTWFVTTPGTVSVRRDNRYLVITCTKIGDPTGIANVKPERNTAMDRGSLVTGGPLGYSYPMSPITVIMGRTELVY